MECMSSFMSEIAGVVARVVLYNVRIPRTAYTSILFPALLFDWLITLILTLTIFDDIIPEKSAGSKTTQDRIHSTFIPGTFV